MAQTNGLYEQVLEYARREIDEATAKVEEMRQSLQLLEARVEAAKSVYEAVAARLNLEDELEGSAPLQGAAYAPPPPPQAVETITPPPPEPAVEAPEPEPIPTFELPAPAPAPPAPAPAPVVEHPAPAPAPAPPAPAPAPVVEPVVEHPAPAPEPASEPVGMPGPSQGNGTSDGFSVDLIRQHLEQRAHRAAEVEQQGAVPKPAPAPAPAPPAPAPEPVVEHLAPAPPAPEPAPEPPAPAPAAQAGSSSSGGFELSEADRALIGEYLRSKQGG